MSSRRREVLDERINDGMRAAITGAVLNNERIARQFGINVVDLQTLGLISTSSHPMTAGEVSVATGLPTSTTTRVLDRLEKAGFLRRGADPTDRRKVVVSADLSKLRAVESPYEEIIVRMRRLNSGFSLDELEIVARYLEAMGRMGDDDPTADRA